MGRYIVVNGSILPMVGKTDYDLSKLKEEVKALSKALESYEESPSVPVNPSTLPTTDGSIWITT